jgi:RND family efflux transporter MFP subunit
MTIHVDLQQLATPRPKMDAPRVRHRNRIAWLTRYLLPFVLIAGFLGALLYSFRESLLPAQPVTVAPVLAVRTEISQSEAPLFQSAGWVEPRPTAVVVSAIEEGIVEELLVIEGQELKQGDVVARLIQADAKLRLQQAEAEFASREAELASSQAALTAAEIRLQEPIELQTKIAEAEAMLARVENEFSRLPSQVKAAAARLDLAAMEKQSRNESSDVVGKLAIARAENEFQIASAALSELEAQRVAVQNELAAQQRRVAGLRRQLELKVEENKQRDEAKAAVDLGEARLLSANVMLETAKLSLSRTTIYAPADGKVLALVARPGSKVMGLTPASMPDASTVITMYDPAKIQVRADVRLEDVPGVFPGQKIRIETPAVKGPLLGEVIAATSFTDIQKNTLQVKVSVDNPPPVLRPDMLVQCTFLSPATVTSKTEDADQKFTLLVPPEFVEQTSDSTTVWIADRNRGVARVRTIVLGGETADGMREVKSGLAVGDRLIVTGKDGLEDGERIRITGEAATSDAGRHEPHNGEPAMKMKRL